MPEQISSSGQPDDAMNDMVAQVAARVIAAMREEAGTAPGTNSSPTPSIPSSPSEVAEQARQTASGVVEAVQQQAVSRLDKQKEHAAEELASVAGTVRQMGDQLKQPEHGAVAQYAAHYGDVAADQLQQISGYLRQHDVKQLVREVEGFARREPLLFTGGAFVLGLMGARFLKSQPLPAETPETPDSPAPDVARDVASSVEAVSPLKDTPASETGPSAPPTTPTPDVPAPADSGRLGFIAVDDEAVDEKFFRDQFADDALLSGANPSGGSYGESAKTGS